MKLTQKQNMLVARYLREVREQVKDEPDTTQERIMEGVRSRITKELNGDSNSNLRDDEVLAVLHGLGSPGDLIQEMHSQRGSAHRLALSTADCCWLGVCGGLAARLRMSSRLLRCLLTLVAAAGPVAFLLHVGLHLFSFATALVTHWGEEVAWPSLSPLAFVLGLCGPLLLMAYLVLYFELYWTGNADAKLRIEAMKVAKYLASTVLGTAACHVLALGTLALIDYGYMRMFDKGAPLLDTWGWLGFNATPLLVGTLCVLLPMALLGGLPVSDEWDQTAKRLIQAGLAVYALVLSVGVACALAGALLLGVQAYTGGTPLL